MYVQAPLESDTQLAKACKPAMRSLHDPAVLAQAFTAFDASPGNAAEDSSLFEVSPAARVVIPLVCMEFAGASARAPLQAFDCRDGIHTLLKQHRIVSVGPADKNHQWNATGIHDDVTFGA